MYKPNPPFGYFLLTPNWNIAKDDLYWNKRSWCNVPEIAVNEKSTIYEYVARKLPRDVYQSLEFDWDSYVPSVTPCNFSPTKLFIEKYRSSHRKVHDHDTLQEGDIYLDVNDKESDVSSFYWGQKVSALPGRTVLRRIGR